MEDIYLIYKNSLQADGYVEVIGSYLGYNVAKIQKIYIDNRINISKLNPIVIRKELALVWRFADTYDGKITVKLNTNVAEQLQDKFSEKQLIDLEEKGKIKYIGKPDSILPLVIS